MGVHLEEDVMGVHYGCGEAREVPWEVDDNCLEEDVVGGCNPVAEVDDTPVA